MKRKLQCEGWRRYGGAFSFGPVTWKQCPQSATVMLTVKQEGKVKTLPACPVCWQECMDNKIEILSVKPV